MFYLFILFIYLFIFIFYFYFHFYFLLIFILFLLLLLLFFIYISVGNEVINDVFLLTRRNLKESKRSVYSWEDRVIIGFYRRLGGSIRESFGSGQGRISLGVARKIIQVREAFKYIAQFPIYLHKIKH